MKIRATFPVHVPKDRKFENCLIHFGEIEQFLICKSKNNRDCLAIDPQNCEYDEISMSTICENHLDERKCTGCIACQIGLAQPHEGLNAIGVPVLKPHYTYSELAEQFFNGKYVAFPPEGDISRPAMKKFNDYTGNWDERNFTNPLIAAYIWATSKGTTYVSCSPNAELSLSLSPIRGEREGHLDVTSRSFYRTKKYLFVGEGKRNVKVYLDDSKRDQQYKYEEHVNQQGTKHDFLTLFSYVIGGNEEPLYPISCHKDNIPKYNRKFYYDICENRKRFISIHALRGLGILNIASESKIGIENTIFPLFENRNIYGLVSGGAVVFDGKNFLLENLSKYVAIR